jgi:hypothetical protein
MMLLRRGPQLSAKPRVRSEGLHGIDLLDYGLMDVLARRAPNLPNVDVRGAGCNPRQGGSRLARGAKWSGGMMLRLG